MPLGVRRAGGRPARRRTRARRVDDGTAHPLRVGTACLVVPARGAPSGDRSAADAEPPPRRSWDRRPARTQAAGPARDESAAGRAGRREGGPRPCAACGASDRPSSAKVSRTSGSETVMVLRARDPSRHSDGRRDLRDARSSVDDGGIARKRRPRRKGLLPPRHPSSSGCRRPERRPRSIRSITIPVGECACARY